MLTRDVVYLSLQEERKAWDQSEWASTPAEKPSHVRLNEDGKDQSHHGEYVLKCSQFRGGVGPDQKAGAGPTVPM